MSHKPAPDPLQPTAATPDGAPAAEHAAHAGVPEMAATREHAPAPAQAAHESVRHTAATTERDPASPAQGAHAGVPPTAATRQQEPAQAARGSVQRVTAASEPAPIPLVDLAAQHAALQPDLQRAFQRVLESQHFILGPEVSAFEAEVAELLGVPHALGVSSGTDALLLALLALNIGPGDEVLVPAFSFFATAGCVARVGARPVFVDIDPLTYNIDIAAAAARVTPDTKAIIPVHLYGQVCDLEALSELAREHNLQIIEDAAQALGAGAGQLSTSEFACFSFFPTKNLGALGDAGLVTTHDAALAKRARLLRAHGAEPKYHHALIGGNFRIDALQAAFLRAKLPHLAGWNSARQQNARLYDELFARAELPETLLRTPARQHASHIYHQYVIQTPQRDALQAHLQRERIGSEVYYPVPLHLQVCFAHLGEKAGSHPVAERAAREVLALPIYPELAPPQIERVAGVVSDFLRHFG